MKPKIPVWNWRDAVRRSEMSTGAKCLCHAISSYLSDAAGYAYPSVESLMKDVSCSNTSIARYVKEAVEAEYLRVQRMRNKQGHVYGTHYHPTFPKNAIPAEAENVVETNLNDKSSFRPSLDGKSSSRGESLSENLSRLSDKSSRHNSQNNSPIKNPNTAPQEAQGAPSFEEFSAKVPRRKGIANARKLWAKLTPQAKLDAFTGLDAYRSSDEVKRGFAQQGDTYLSKRTWEDFQPAEPAKAAPNPAELAIKQARALALDLAHQNWRHAAHFWASFDEVPASMIEAARNYARTEWDQEIPSILYREAV